MHSSALPTSTNTVVVSSSNSQQHLLPNLETNSNSSSNCHSSLTIDNCEPSTSKEVEDSTTNNSPTDESKTIPTAEDEEKRAARNQATKVVYKFFVDSLVSSTVMKYHRDIALNSMVGLTCQSDNAMPITGTPSSTISSSKKSQQSADSSSTQSSSASSSKTLLPVRKQIECECYSCHRVIAAVRLAPHLEKCIGLGRNSSRVARKRLAHFAIGKSQSASSSPRLNTRVSMSSNNTDMSTIDDAIESEDTEWRASQTPPKVAKRNQNMFNNGTGSMPPSNSRNPNRIRHR